MRTASYHGATGGMLMIIEPHKRSEWPTLGPLQHFCPKCGTKLKRTGIQKLIYPPINVMNCDVCIESYLVSSE